MLVMSNDLSRACVRFAAVAFAVGMAGIGCGGGGSSPTSPSGAGGGSASSGAWTGTIARPGGLAPISVRWDVTTNEDGLFGPMTLTNGAASVTVQARGLTGGNDRQGYTIHISLNSNAGDFAAFPSCSVRGNSAGAQSGDPFPSPYTTITTPAFSISFSGCRGFIDTGYPNAQSNFIQETGQLNLRK